jgi:hypothetical protein
MICFLIVDRERYQDGGKTARLLVGVMLDKRDAARLGKATRYSDDAGWAKLPRTCDHGRAALSNFAHARALERGQHAATPSCDGRSCGT